MVSGRILTDWVVGLSDGQPVRLIRAIVEVDGKDQEMVFLTNRLDWSAETIVELYRCRWQIEVFFKQLKQTLKLCDFVGNSANVIRWQVWMALLAHLLIRLLSWCGHWQHSFVRLFALVRGAIETSPHRRRPICMVSFETYGTASAPFEPKDSALEY